MQRLRFLAPLIFVVFHAATALGASDDLFQQGLAAYQNKQYAEARESFQKLAARECRSGGGVHGDGPK